MPVSAKYIVALSAGEGYINDTTAGTTGQHFLRLNLNYSVTCLPVSLCPCTDFSMIYLELDQLGHRVVTDMPDAGKLLHKGAMPPRPPTFHISANTSYCSQTWNMVPNGYDIASPRFTSPSDFFTVLLFISFAHFSIVFFFPVCRYPLHIFDINHLLF